MSFHQSPHSYVSHVHLHVTDIIKSRHFYTGVVGFQVHAETEDRVELTADGETVLITIEQPAEVRPKQRRRTGLYHYALLLPYRSHLADILQHLLKNNYPLQGASDHLVSEAVYLADPDGNGIELYVDRPADRWVWRKGEVRMTTERLDAENLYKEATGSWKGMPTGVMMGHIHLHVSELEKTRHFYVEGLGFDVVNSQYGSQVLFISTGGYHHHIGLNTWAGEGASAADSNTAGLDYFTLSIPSQRLKKTMDQLERIGAVVKEEDNGWFTEDPSGNTIALKVDRNGEKRNKQVEKQG